MNGRKLSDSEFEQMMASINPETIKMGTNMAKNNPDFVRKATENYSGSAAQQRVQTPSMNSINDES